MTRLLLVACTLAAAACTPPRHAAPSAAADLAIRGVNVVDVESGTVLADRTVLIRGSRIVSVESGSGRILPGAFQHVDGAGKYLVPGLWDMHVHITHPMYGPLFIANGITGVRDMGGGADRVTDGCESMHPDSLRTWRDDLTDDASAWPRLVLSGPAVSGTGWPTSLPARTADEARVAVRQLQTLGVDFIKVYEGIPLDAYHALAAAARDAALPLAGHVPLETVSLTDAMGAGHRSIEHVRDHLLLCFSADRADLDRFFADDGWGAEDVAWGRARHAECPRVIELLQTGGAWLTPTLVVERSKVAIEESEFVDDVQRARLPRPVQEGFAAFVRNKQAQTTASRASEQLWWRTQVRLVGRMASEGAAFLAGTDAACEGGLPGFSLHDELELLVQAGLTPLQALRSATLNPAQFLNATDSLGTVAPGKLADLLLLDANPLEDIRNSTRIHAVVVKGRYMDRRALNALLEEARAAPGGAGSGSSLPILDMHMHARTAAHYGTPPVPMCAPVERMPRWHQRKPMWEDGSPPPCTAPLLSPATDEALFRETLAVMERHSSMRP